MKNKVFIKLALALFALWLCEEPLPSATRPSLTVSSVPDGHIRVDGRDDDWKAFDEAPSEKPPHMIKLNGEDTDELPRWTEEALTALGVDILRSDKSAANPDGKRIGHLFLRRYARQSKKGTGIFSTNPTL